MEGIKEMRKEEIQEEVRRVDESKKSKNDARRAVWNSVWNVSSGTQPLFASSGTASSSVVYWSANTSASIF